MNIGKNGKVKGSISTEYLIIQGFVDGTIDAKRVEIKANGHVRGEINSQELVIESKGIFEGNSIVKNLQTADKKIKEV